MKPGEGSCALNILAWMTVTMLRIGGRLADAMKNNVKTAKDNNIFTLDVKGGLLVLRKIYGQKLTATLRGFSYAFEPSMVTLLPETHEIWEC